MFFLQNTANTHVTIIYFTFSSDGASFWGWLPVYSDTNQKVNKHFVSNGCFVENSLNKLILNVSV